MALINCKECGSKISDKAPACVHCGGPVPASAAPAAPKKKTTPKAVWLGLLIVGAGIFLGWDSGLNKEWERIMAPFAPPKPLPPRPPPKPPIPLKLPTPLKPPAIAPVSPVMSVSAIQLFQDYKTNKVSADRIYKGKNLLVTGVVDSLNKNVAEAPCVLILAGGPSQTVRAQFPKNDRPQLSTLTRGQKITVSCIGNGMLTASPALKGCTVSESELSDLPPK